MRFWICSLVFVFFLCRLFFEVVYFFCLYVYFFCLYVFIRKYFCRVCFNLILIFRWLGSF